MKTLVLCLDIDNDLGKKAGIKGPVVGIDENINAAVSLALKDPMDSDANAIFRAVSLCKEMRAKGKECEVATLTGDEMSTANATANISQQLDYVLKLYPAEEAYIITDGLSDESVMPLIASRITVRGSEIITVKQAKGLEKTYVVLLEKLRDPHYAKLLLGIPGLFIALLSLAHIFSIPLPYLGFLFGTYLILRGFGVWGYVRNVTENLQISRSPLVNALFYIFLGVVLVIALLFSYQAYQKGVELGLKGLALYFYSLGSFLDIAILAFIISVGMKALSHYLSGRMEAFLLQLSFAIAGLTAYGVARAFIQWYVALEPPYLTFGQFLAVMFGLLGLSFVLLKTLYWLRRGWIRAKVKEGAKVYTKDGFFLGRVVGKSAKALIISSPMGRRFEIPYDRVEEVEREQVLAW